VRNSVLFENAEIGRHCQIQNTIVEKGIFVPANTRIGFDEEEDRSRGIFVDESGIRIVPQEMEFDR
jgi:glucose-1-phosphate adenylyltransferase